MTERRKAQVFWDGLDSAERGEIGDQLVLAGTFDWRDWMAGEPSKEFLDAVEQERLYWESEAT